MKAPRHLFSFLFALLILAGSVMPAQNIPNVPVWNIDKLVHISFYAVFGFLLIREYQQYRPLSSRSNIIWTVVVCGAYGLFIELLQGNYIVNRFFDVYDLIANIIGVILGLVAFEFLTKLRT